MRIRFLIRTTLAIALLLPCMLAAQGSPDDVRYSPADEMGRYVYLVEFSSPGMLRHEERSSGEEFDPRSPGALRHRERLKTEQTVHIQAFENLLGRQLQVTHRYLASHSGMAVRLEPNEAERIRSLPGIDSVERERVYELATYRGPTFIGADTIWDGSTTPDGMATRGEGMVIAILDTGIDSDHPAFGNNPDCGHGLDGNPDKLISSLACSGTDVDGLCNGLNPEDANGHGTHTSSTAAGNVLDETAVPTPAIPAPFTELSGVAPCAHIRSYKVCPGSSCPLAQIQAGMDSVLLHGDADVMNFSISGGGNPWVDNDRQKLDLVDAGVLVAAAAGNTSAAAPDPVGRVQHRGPWVLTVAASTRDGNFPGVLSASGPGEPPSGAQDIAANKGSASPPGAALEDHPIRHFDEQSQLFEGCTPGQDGAPADLEPFPTGFFDGAVALIQRGTCPFTTKITNAHAAGADMVVIRNNSVEPVNMNTVGQPEVPAYSIELSPGSALANFVADHPDTATVDFELIDGGDALAGFSLRGPTPAPYQNLTKPDIAAPGVAIYAPVPDGYGNLSGTSMASPHAAGAATLVRALHPDWNVSEVKSALMMTAFQDGTREDRITPWDADDVGSGRVDLTRASRSGLVMNETIANYLAANPGEGGDVRTLNLPSMRDVNCAPDCSFNRTVRSSLKSTSTWDVEVDVPEGFDVLVSPQSFSLEAGESLALDVTATVRDNEPGEEMRFGTIHLVPGSADQSPPLHLTLAVRGEGPRAAIDLDPPELSAEIEVGSTESRILGITNIGAAELIWSIGHPGSSGCDGVPPVWLDVLDMAGTTPPGDSAEIEIEFDAGAVPIGNYDDALCVESNDPDEAQITVPVFLSVTELIQEADLSVSLDAGDEFVPEGGTIEWQVTVANHGPRDVTGADVIAALGDGVTDIEWTCIPESGAFCEASGSGALNESVDLDAGTSVEFHVEALLADAGDSEQVSSSVLVVGPDVPPDPSPGNNLSSQVIQSGVFANGFE